MRPGRRQRTHPESTRRAYVTMRGISVVGITVGVSRTPGGVLGVRRRILLTCISSAAAVTIAARSTEPAALVVVVSVPAWQWPYFEAVQEALEHVGARPNVPYWEDVSRGMNDAFRDIVQSRQPAKATLDRYAESIQRVKTAAGI